ncbi:MAG TPA: hypothetical protein VHP81_09805, partial [Lachnospiraceae bacterium]|nr:hypothetical protein [Lachnospiraceae bacterium]
MQRNIFKIMVKKILGLYRILQGMMDKRKIRTKTAYLYMFCVLIPVIITNILIIGNMLKVSKKEMNDNINNIGESIAQDIASTLENAVYVTVDLYANNFIYNFLDTQYINSSHYFHEYNKVFNNYVFYATSKHLISFMNFYSDNPTIFNGGRCYRVDSIQQEVWYKEFIQSKENLFVCAYYNNNDYLQNNNRIFSVIRKLDYVGMHGIEKLVKLDLNYDKISEEIRNYAFDTKVYVAHGDKIIFSNDVKDEEGRVD